MSLVIKRVKEISRKKKKSGWRSKRLQQLQLQQLEEEQLQDEQQRQLQLEQNQQKQPEPETNNEKKMDEPPPQHKRPLVAVTGEKEEPNNKRRCRPCKSCRSRVNACYQFEFIEPVPKNYHKHLDLFAVVEGGPGRRIRFYKKDKVEGPCCGAPGGRCDRYRPQERTHGQQNKGYYAQPPPAENVNLTRGYERMTRSSFLYRFSEPNPPLPPPPPPQFIWTKYGPDNRLSMIYLWNRYDPYLADSKWRRRYGEQMALMRHRNYIAGNRSGFVHTPYN